MLIAYVPLLVAVIGLLLYILASNAKVQELGRLMFFAGILVLALSLAGKTVHLLK